MKHQKLFKSNLWLLMIALFGMTFSTACNEDDDSETITVSVDDAAELVAFSIANTTYGLVYNLDYVAANVLEEINCNESKSNTSTISESVVDEQITLNSEIAEEYSMTCDSGEVVNYSFDTDQRFTSVRFDYDQVIDGTWTIGGVEESSASYIYNGSYDRNGEWTYNLRDKHTDNITYSSVLDQLMADKDSGRITSGTATFSIMGTSTVYDDYDYAGDVEFKGSDMAIITFQTGEQYEFNLETGEIDPI
ncbi:MAG: hypothetical protein AAFP19_07450 [Bacteroidota bacterium]